MMSVFYMVNRYAVEAAAWIMTSFTLLIFGEIIPKFYARANSEKITVISATVLVKMEFFLNLFYIIL